MTKSNVARLLMLGQAVDPVPLGRRIRHLRRGAGLTQADLAGGKVTAAYISRIEAGERTPSVGLLEVIAGQLGVSVAVLLHPTDPAAPEDAADDYLAIEAVALATAAWLEDPLNSKAYGRMVAASQRWSIIRKRGDALGEPIGL